MGFGECCWRRSRPPTPLFNLILTTTSRVEISRPPTHFFRNLLVFWGSDAVAVGGSPDTPKEPIKNKRCLGLHRIKHLTTLFPSTDSEVGPRGDSVSLPPPFLL